jgi:CelD/BcsL family acetyltransferase involved in cellulose biosynthesis
MNVNWVDPLRDPRWPRFLLRHARASVFHTPGWLEALRRTYGYEPAVLTTSPSDRELSNGIVFCRIHSRLTGRRLVSLPFSDHCEPLVDVPEELAQMLAALADGRERERWRHVEIRPRTTFQDLHARFAASGEHWLHTLDLSPGPDELLQQFHRDCIQRKIRRAEREGLVVETGKSQPLLNEFYELLLLARRRFNVPPHPRAWFRNLIDTLAEDVEISVARKDSRPVASILTLRYKDTLVYKYGCSDARHTRLGGVHLLFWRAIRQAKERGARELDLGRSDSGDLGLIVFKDRWGCTRSPLRYWRSPAALASKPHAWWAVQVGKPVLRAIPAPFLPTIGKLVARHLG